MQMDRLLTQLPHFARRILAFQRVLTDAGVPAFIRVSGGRDIGAACGQLRAGASATTPVELRGVSG